jgi:hypothetical protein
MAQTCGKTASTIPTTTTTATTTYRVRHGQMTWKGWVNTGERGKKCTARHHPRLTIRRSSDTWNEPPHAEQHVADHNPQAASAQPQYTSQYTPHHTSHTRAPPSSPPRHVNDSGHRPTHTHHAPVPYSRPDTIPAAQSGRTYRSADLTSSYRPDTFTDLSPQNSHSRSGIESFFWWAKSGGASSEQRSQPKHPRSQLASHRLRQRQRRRRRRRRRRRERRQRRHASHNQSRRCQHGRPHPVSQHSHNTPISNTQAQLF